MNRLVHLRETLPVNIQENRDYPNLEFILLDYNSPDGLEQWVNSNMQEYMRSGLLKYYKTKEPDIFYLSHSKNMALKLATGDIICMVDSDNFAGPGYARWINEIFSKNGEKAIITTLLPDCIPYRDQGGKLCFHRDLFHQVAGFDESLIGYGVEDMDLVNRMEEAGGFRIPIEDPGFLQFIRHSDYERLKNHHLINNLTGLYIQQTKIMNVANTVLYLLQDQSFYQVHYEFDKSLKGNPVKGYAGWKIREDNGHRSGIHEWNGPELTLYFKDGATVRYTEDKECLLRGRDNISQETCTWEQPGTESEMFYGLIMAYGECFNRLTTMINKKHPAHINSNGWGRSTVYLNSNYDYPFHLA